MNTSQSASQRPAASGSGRRTLVLVFLLGAAPVVGAYLLFYFFPDWIPRSTINHGTLVSPARPLSVEKIVDADGKPHGIEFLRGHWTYVHFVDGGCDDDCANDLVATRQVRLTTGKDIQRVRRVLVASGSAVAGLRSQLLAAHPDLMIVSLSGDAVAFRGQFESATGARMFLVDPIGNFMMYYVDRDPSAMRKDLARLLKVSTVG
ncbi:MAG: hypothetical protein KDG50_13585 [Chromatiales bacterium]|nr:hypothetical protein [Chromatiales bacterium]